MLGLAALALVSASQPLPEYERIAPDEVVQRVEDCGFERVRVEYDELLQSDVLHIDDEQASDEELLCLFRAIDRTFYDFSWSNPLALQYHEVVSPIMAERSKEHARRYFDEHPELGTPPQRKSEQSDIELARAIEQFCGEEAEGIFTDAYGGIAVSPGWMKIGEWRTQADVLWCALNSATLRGLSVSFIANEVQPEDPAHSSDAP